MSAGAVEGWTNKLIWGDNKLILSSLKNGPLREEIEAQGGLKLIYIDRPLTWVPTSAWTLKSAMRRLQRSRNPEEIAYRTRGQGY